MFEVQQIYGMCLLLYDQRHVAVCSGRDLEEFARFLDVSDDPFVGTNTSTVDHQSRFWLREVIRRDKLSVHR